MGAGCCGKFTLDVCQLPTVLGCDTVRVELESVTQFCNYVSENVGFVDEMVFVCLYASEQLGTKRRCIFSLLL